MVVFSICELGDMDGTGILGAILGLIRALECVDGIGMIGILGAILGLTRILVSTITLFMVILE